MKRFLRAVHKVDISFQAVAGTGFVFMMAMTMADITMRALGRPIVGSIEPISFSGAITIGFVVCGIVRRHFLLVELVRL
jgi:hypothetical protein